jgi:hypothetical protein
MPGDLAIVLTVLSSGVAVLALLYVFPIVVNIVHLVLERVFSISVPTVFVRKP